jgi:uncharacterized protein (DUF58 family)
VRVGSWVREVRSVLRGLWFFRTTSAGKTALAALMASGLMGLLSLSVPVYHLFLAMAILCAGSLAVGGLLRPRLRLRLHMGERALAGRPLEGRLEVTNAARRSVLDVGAGLFDLPDGLRQESPEAILARLEPGETARLPIVLSSRRRGTYSLPAPRAYSRFPFGLWRFGREGRSRPRLVVCPAFTPLKPISLPPAARYQPGGIALSSQVGESPEYIGNRQYRPGDSLRRIDFRSWARLARPVVREYREEYYSRVALVLDTYVPWHRVPGRRGFADLEAGVSLTAAAAEALSRGETIIDLFAAGPQLYVFRSGRHTAPLENVLEILAGVGACRRNPFETILPAMAEPLGNISAVLCILLDWDEPRRALVRRALEAGCAARTVVVRRGRTTLDPAADEDWAGPITVVEPRQVHAGEVDHL